MLHFVVPLKSKQVSRDWQLINCFLERTLFSLMRQTDSRIRISLVCHERPTLPKIISDSIDIICVEHDAPALGMEVAYLRRDKYLKQAVGLQRALHCGSEYVMYVDADDLLSRDLAACVRQMAPDVGLIIRRGYILDHKSNLLWEVDRFNKLCGSCAIFRAKPDLMLSQVSEFLGQGMPHASMGELMQNEDPYFLGTHSSYERKAANYGAALDVSQLPMVLYRWDHGHNTNYAKAFRLSPSKKLRHFLPPMFSKGSRWQPRQLGSKLRVEFGLL